MSLEDLRHPDCRACEERLRVNLGLMAEIRKLKEQLEEPAPEDLGPKKFAEHLRGHRAHARLSLSEAATRAGIAAVTWRRYESGEHDVPTIKRRALAEAVGWR